MMMTPSLPDTTARPLEAKDVIHANEPTYDVGAHLGHRRIAHIAALALLGAIATVFILAVGLFVQLTRNRFVPVPVDVANGRVIALTGDFVLDDSTLYQPAQVIETARRFLDWRFAYDFRSGVARILAARMLVQTGFAATALMPPSDLIARYNAQETRITLAVDSTRVRYVAHGMLEVTFVGTKFLNNVEYSDALGPRRTPFKETVFLARVRVSPEFPEGLAVRGAKGDLE